MDARREGPVGPFESALEHWKEVGMVLTIVGLLALMLYPFMIMADILNGPQARTISAPAPVTGTTGDGVPWVAGK
jgi:hypothetical protein